VRSILNLSEVGPSVVAQLRGEAMIMPSLRDVVARVTATIEQALGRPLPRAAGAPVSAPVLTTRYRTAHGTLAFFSMYSTFGTPHDITLASLRVEHLFPADNQTRDLLRAHVP
jgi:hypothetical protein